VGSETVSVDFGKRPERGTEFLDTQLFLLLESMSIVLIKL
jgi:hypothetical protein